MAASRFRSRLLHSTAVVLDKPPPLSAVKSIPSQSSTTKIGIVIRSFEHQNLEKSGLPPFTQRVGLPTTRSLYTVLRSPHVDKKSREQFEMRIYKQFLVIKTERQDLYKKLFWLKRHRHLGGQMELRVQSQTRLDPKDLKKYLAGEVSGAIETKNVMVEAGEEVADGA